MNEKEEALLLSCLKRVSPGTALRTGIEYILQGKTGGLVVVGNSEEVLKLVNGGFYIGCSFSPAKFYELAKMDGAIILSSNAKRILYANTHLFPNPEIATSETGTRHRTAERVARQTKTLVISISQKRDVITIYDDNIKYYYTSGNIQENPEEAYSVMSRIVKKCFKTNGRIDYNYPSTLLYYIMSIHRRIN